MKNLKKAGLNKAREGSWARVILEKPFGTDLKSARHLNRVVQSAFSEDQTYRIDHFLGKETAQNILVLRFANAIFEPLWNTRYIDHVQITAAETLGVENRAGYYESAGALRDMVQNHLAPVALSGRDGTADRSRRGQHSRRKGEESVRSLRRFSDEEVGARMSSRGQYARARSAANRCRLIARRRASIRSRKPRRIVALRVRVDNWRWADVPIYVRVGKRLPKSGHGNFRPFQKAPQVLFNRESEALDQNVLVIRIQPDEGISLRMQAKVPGTSFRIESVKMDFHYGTSFGKASPEAYERLCCSTR